MNKKSGAVVVSWDFNNKDSGILLVGSQNNGEMKIVNAFSGEEAKEIYEKLITKKEVK